MSPDTGKTPTFEESLNELEEIVRALETGEASLEESLAKYEAGVSLLKHCYAQLRQAEQRVLLLAGEDADGKPIVQPFEAPATSEAPALGNRRKSRKPDSEY